MHIKTTAQILEAKRGLPKGTIVEVLFIGQSGIAKVQDAKGGRAYLAPNEYDVLTVKGMSK